MDTEPSLCHDHSTDAASEKVKKDLNPETRASNVEHQQQPHNLPIIQSVNVHASYSDIDVGSAFVSFECSSGGNDPTVAARKQPLEEFLL